MSALQRAELLFDQGRYGLAAGYFREAVETDSVPS